MNKQEAIKKTEELEKQLAELKAIIEAPDTSELVFKPKGGGDYFAIGSFCDIIDFINYTQSTTDRHIKVGNCFRTKEDAKNSAKYYIMNSEYDYWFPWSGQPKPKVLPKGLEAWNQSKFTSEWNKTKTKNMVDVVYRWKRSEQG